MNQNWTEARHGKLATLNFHGPPKHGRNTVSIQKLLEHLKQTEQKTDEITAVMPTGEAHGYIVAHGDPDHLAKMADGLAGTSQASQRETRT